MSYQNDFEAIHDELQRGLISAAEANVKLVQCSGVRLITTKLRADVRNALRDAVNAGQLGHLKKDGQKPEAFFHVNAEGKAKQMRKEQERSVFAALASVVTRPFEC